MLFRGRPASLGSLPLLPCNIPVWNTPGLVAIQDSFPILSLETTKPTEFQWVLLLWCPEQGKYIKSLPLHTSQQIIVDNNTELMIKLFICVTFDFQMELLSLCNHVRILQPASLAKEIREEHRTMGR